MDYRMFEEDEILEILDLFFNGIYIDAVKEMLRINLEPQLLADYVADLPRNDSYRNFMTIQKFAHIGMSYQQLFTERLNDVTRD